MKTFIAKVKFNTGIHIGETSTLLTKVDNLVHSDTLFSAIINIYSLIFGLEKTNKLLEKIINENYLKISSMFYFHKDILLIPKPFGININTENIQDYKKIKKTKFIPIDLIYKSNLNLTTQELDKIYHINKSLYFEDERPRVSIDRIRNTSNIYYISYYYLPSDVGMWFFIQVHPEIQNEIFTAIRILGDEGIGGEKTYGFGMFQVSFQEYSIPSFDNQSFYLNLSLTNPLEEELESILYYSIKTRKGYMYSPYVSGVTQPEVNVIEEGSVFKKELRGRILDVTPKNFNKHKIYKYFRSFCIPIKSDLFQIRGWFIWNNQETTKLKF